MMVVSNKNIETSSWTVIRDRLYDWSSLLILLMLSLCEINGLWIFFLFYVKLFYLETQLYLADAYAFIRLFWLMSMLMQLLVWMISGQCNHLARQMTLILHQYISLNIQWIGKMMKFVLPRVLRAIVLSNSSLVLHFNKVATVTVDLKLIPSNQDHLLHDNQK